MKPCVCLEVVVTRKPGTGSSVKGVMDGTTVYV